MQRIFQRVIRLDLPKESLEEAVRRAFARGQGQVHDILSSKTCFHFQDSLFLQLLCNRVQLGRELQYGRATSDNQDLHSVVTETIRTITVISADGKRY